MPLTFNQKSILIPCDNLLTFGRLIFSKHSHNSLIFAVVLCLCVCFGIITSDWTMNRPIGCDCNLSCQDGC